MRDWKFELEPDQGDRWVMVVTLFLLPLALLL